jgi:hypothetical protein
MTTAPDNRGGANGGPQYNPANVSATGGNGQSGTQAPKYMPGLEYGQGQVNMANQGQAPLMGNPTAAVTDAAPMSLPPITGLNAPTQFPDQPVTDGADGPSAGSDSSSLRLPAMAAPMAENAIQVVQALYMMDPTNQDLRFVLEGLQNDERL